MNINHYKKIVYKIILHNNLIRYDIDKYNIVLEYLSYMPFDLMELEDFEDFVNDFDYDISRIQEVLKIFKQY
jgi:hypothetical protein